jgi:hypothetical protein
MIIDTLFVAAIYFFFIFSAKIAQTALFVKKISQLIVFEKYLLRVTIFFITRVLFIFIKRGDLTALANRRRRCFAPHRREIS